MTDTPAPVHDRGCGPGTGLIDTSGKCPACKAALLRTDAPAPVTPRTADEIEEMIVPHVEGRCTNPDLCVALTELRMAERREAAAPAATEALRAALLKSADRFHGLSDDSPHLYHVFSECPHDYCVEARAALASPEPTPVMRCDCGEPWPCSLHADPNMLPPEPTPDSGLDVERLVRICTLIGAARPWLLDRAMGMPNEGKVLAEVIAAEYARLSSADSRESGS